MVDRQEFDLELLACRFRNAEAGEFERLLVGVVAGRFSLLLRSRRVSVRTGEPDEGRDQASDQYEGEDRSSPRRERRLVVILTDVIDLLSRSQGLWHREGSKWRGGGGGDGGGEQLAAAGNCRAPEEALPEEAVAADKHIAAADIAGEDTVAPGMPEVGTAGAGIAAVYTAEPEIAEAGNPGVDSWVEAAEARVAEALAGRTSPPSRHKMGIRNKKGQLLFRTSDISR